MPAPPPLRPPPAALRALAAAAALATAAVPGCAPRAPSAPVIAAPTLSPTDRCAAALAATNAAAGDDLGAARADVGLAGCVDVFAAAWPRCGDAWRGLAATAPEARGAAILDACRNIYCLDLPAPQPALCEGTIPRAPEARHAGAVELFAAAAALDGTSAILAPLGAPDPTLVVGPPPPEPPRVELVLRRGPTGLRAVLGDRTLDLPRTGDLVRPLDGLLGAAEGRSLAVAADRDLVLADVIGVLDAAKALGFQRIALQTAAE